MNLAHSSVKGVSRAFVSIYIRSSLSLLTSYIHLKSLSISLSTYFNFLSASNNLSLHKFFKKSLISPKTSSLISSFRFPILDSKSLRFNPSSSFIILSISVVVIIFSLLEFNSLLNLLRLATNLFNNSFDASTLARTLFTFTRCY